MTKRFWLNWEKWKSSQQWWEQGRRGLLSSVLIMLSVGATGESRRMQAKKSHRTWRLRGLESASEGWRSGLGEDC